MNLYLILKSTLTAIADAIREKLGSTDDMTPLDMPALIRSIQTGGGGWELIAEATATENVEVLRVDVPAAKQMMASYLVVYDCTFVGGSKYPCPRLNSISHGSPYMSSTNHYVKANGIAYSGTGYKMLVSNGTVPSGNNNSGASTVKYVSMVGYYSDDQVAAGSTIKVYGIETPS